jgi:hypothetical protein
MSASSPVSAPKTKRRRDPSEVIEVLTRLGVAKEFAAQFASSLGDKLFEILAQDPYSLCELLGLSFLEVDTFATRQGFPREHKGRLRAGILHLLAGEEADGNCFSIRGTFLRRAARVLQAGEPAISAALQELCAQGKVIPQGERLWSKSLSELEAEVAQRVLILCAPPEEASAEGPVPEPWEEGSPEPEALPEEAWQDAGE